MRNEILVHRIHSRAYFTFCANYFTFRANYFTFCANYFTFCANVGSMTSA